MPETVGSGLTTQASASLADLQRRLEHFDAERGWDAVKPAHTALHLIEELGEVMRELLHLEGYKPTDSAARERLGGELADVMLLLCKLATQSGIDLERVVVAKMLANEARFPLDRAKLAMEHYLQQQGLEHPKLESSRPE